MSSDQEKLDALFGVSPQARLDMAEGKTPPFLVQLREREWGPVRDYRISAVMVGVLAVGLGLGGGWRGGPALFASGVLSLVALGLGASTLRSGARRRRLRAAPASVRLVEGSATTARYWFPTYGEVSLLCADLVLGEERFVLPSSFEEHIVVGPVRVFVFEPELCPDEANPARGRAIAIELLPGAYLTRSSPKNPPPKNFLRIEPAD